MLGSCQNLLIGRMAQWPSLGIRLHGTSGFDYSVPYKSVLCANGIQYHSRGWQGMRHKRATFGDPHAASSGLARGATGSGSLPHSRPEPRIHVHPVPIRMYRAAKSQARSELGLPHFVLAQKASNASQQRSSLRQHVGHNRISVMICGNVCHRIGHIACLYASPPMHYESFISRCHNTNAHVHLCQTGA